MSNIITKALLFLIAASMVVSIFAVSGGATSDVGDNELGTLAVSATVTSHDIIVIDSDTDFAAQAASEGWDGNGTSASPYIIEGYDIDAEGNATGIYVGNTTVYFTIRDCAVYGADQHLGFLDSPLNVRSYGILLNNVTNAVVEENEVYESSFGIFLCESDENTVTGNDVYNNTNDCITMYSADNNTVSDNVLDSSNYCLTLDSGSDYNVLSNNTITDNFVGIYAISAIGNTIEDNVLEGNDFGIYLNTDCVNNTVTGNEVSDGANDGITTRNAENNVISDNTIVNCYYGLCMAIGSTDNQWLDNVADGNVYGVYVTRSEGNVIDGNTLINNDDGVYMEIQADNNIISNNTIENNWSGVFVEDSEGNTIEANVIRDNSDGVHLENDANDNNITGNFFQYNYCGVYSWDSSGNVIYDNAMIDNVFGIDFDRSSGNFIKDNYISGSASYAVRLSDGSDGNDVFGNTFVWNNDSDDTYDVSFVQAYDDGTNQWNDSTHGNYWTGWTSPDANGDGIVDAPYAIAGGDMMDNLPLTTSSLYTPPQIGDIEGLVTDEDGNVLAYVTVTLETGESAVTDAYGLFSFENITAGTYSVVFAKLNHTVVVESVTVTDGNITDMGTVVLNEDAGSEGDTGDATTAYLALVVVVLVAVAAIVIMYFRMKK